MAADKQVAHEIACVYSALILADDDVAITADKISTILKAANVEVEPHWPALFAKAFTATGAKPKDLLVGAASGAHAAAPVAAAAPAAGGKKEDKKDAGKKEAPKKEEPKKEEKKKGTFTMLFPFLHAFYF